MTFEEWLQKKRDYLSGFYGPGSPSAYLTTNEIDLAEEAWDAAVREAARIADGTVRDLDARASNSSAWGYYTAARDLEWKKSGAMDVHRRLTALTTSAPLEGEPGADHGRGEAK